MPRRHASTAANLAAAAFAAAGLAALSTSAAQLFGPRDATDADLLKNAPALRHALADAARAASDATVALYVEEGGGRRPAALAAGVRPEGLVVTKASEIDDTVSARITIDGEVYDVPGEIVGVSTEHDLAAVRLDLPPGVTLPTIAFEAGTGVLAAGSWLASAAPAEADGPVAAAGNVSVGGVRTIPPSMMQLGIGMGPAGEAGIPVTKVVPGGAADRAGLRPGDLILGRNGTGIGTRREFLRELRFDPPDAEFVLEVSRAGELARVPVRLMGGRLDMEIAAEVAGVPVTVVFPGSAAEEAGLRPADLITRVGDRPVADGPGLKAALEPYRAGDRVEVEVLRDGVPVVTPMQLGDSGRLFRARFQNRTGGTTINRRAVDFPAVIQHDTVLPADEMGGPIVDSAGNVVGLNIARAGRVETYALPAAVVAEQLPALLSGRLPTAPEAAVDAAGLPPPEQTLIED